MNIDEKKIYLVLSPHINYYHSYRGDSKGVTGFGKDIRIFNEIFEELDKIEQRAFSFGKVPISWDYGDLFWSIQLQKEFQANTLDRLINRCKQGLDEVLIGSWGNCAQAALDTEELIQDHNWFLENSMGIGVNQLFTGRVAPYARVQETMFTQGMIELYNKLGIKGICLYYSMYGFDVARPFINPRLDWNQRYGLVHLHSTISNASTLMIPMYGFGDRLDFCSTKNWFKFIRKKQETGEIEQHALIFFNFDMDSDNWIRINLPNFLQWMPNSGGLMEFAEAVDKYKFVEFATLIDLVPKLKIYGKAELREDVADGMWNGFYNWAQKYNNTTFWTYGQKARWLKCVSDSIISKSTEKQTIDKVNNLLRNTDDSVETYLKNHILFASTTNFGMAMPFLHPHRYKTAMNYCIKAYTASKKAVDLVLEEQLNNLLMQYGNLEKFMILYPIIIRGISEKEILKVNSPFLVQTHIPSDLIEDKDYLQIKNIKSGKEMQNFHLYSNSTDFSFEAIFSPDDILDDGSIILSLNHKDVKHANKGKLIATERLIQNEHITIKIDSFGKISSFYFDGEELACPKFLESSITFGKFGKAKTYSSKKDIITVLRDGSDGFSAALKIEGEFEIYNNAKVESVKILKLYSNLPYVIVNVSMNIPEIKGESSSVDDSTYYVDVPYDDRWQEVMPCEVRPKILSKKEPLHVWKRNFLGVIDYFNLDMKEIDPKNSDIDCLVANISDGWMALSNQHIGLAIGFDSLKAANFAFSPIKIRDKGFRDLNEKSQQVRINPFGTYYGKLFNYWSDGNGHAQKMTAGLIGTNFSTAPTFSGKKLTFDLALAPYFGDRPTEAIQSFLDHFSLSPLICIGTKEQKELYNNYSQFNDEINNLIKDEDLEKVMNNSYLEWIRLINKDFVDQPNPKSSSEISKLSKITLIKFLFDGIKGR